MLRFIKMKNFTLSTEIHIKPTDIHQYLEYNSCHPNKCKEGIPYGTAKLNVTDVFFQTKIN
jgi:hypothetical protein